MTQWEFTDDEFHVLCVKHLEGMLPAPLTYLSRTPLLADYEGEVAEIRGRLDLELGPEFRQAMEVVARPEVWIGLRANRDGAFGDPAGLIRMHAARQGRRALLLRQEAGETFEHGGNVTVLECDPEELPGLLVAQLPPAKAGRRTSVPIVVAQPVASDPYASSGSGAFDSFDESDESATVAFLSEPVTLAGRVRIAQARSKYGPRGVTGVALDWRDVVDDGRYLIDLSQPELLAVGVDTRQFTDLLAQSIAQIIEQMEWRGEYDE
ncbi:ESX secretion-associated protein EspG [Nocardia sp. NPDC088792]|uniref:ESX secretion-associated protein EspG n=1 Tax=Nocardia sp. NPDC088792 TaxID=3364332 RepID=UPI0038043A94